MLVFANYFHAIDVSTGRTTPGTASLFGTYAVSLSLPVFTVRIFNDHPRQLDYLPAAGCFFDEVCTMISSL